MPALNPQSLFSSGGCYACYGVSQTDLLLLALWDSISQNAGAVDPYDGLLVYTQQNGTTTTVANPTGAFVLNFASKVVSIHCHNCPLITSITCSNNNALVTVDLRNCATLKTLVFSNDTALPSFSLDTFTSLTQLSLDGCTSLNSGTMGFAALQTLGSMTSINSTLTSFNAPVLTTITGGIDISMCSLATLSAPLLVSIGGNANFSIGFYTSVNLNSLQTASGFLLFNSNASPNPVTISLPSLVSVATLLYFQSCANLVSVSCPLLVSVSELHCENNPLLTSVNFNSLQTIGDTVFNFGSDSSLVSVSFPALISPISNCDFSSCTLLVNFSMNNRPWLNGIVASFLNCALSQASVDLILHAGITGGITSDTIDAAGGTSSAPSVAGQADAAALTLAGVSVSTN